MFDGWEETEEEKRGREEASVMTSFYFYDTRINHLNNYYANEIKHFIYLFYHFYQKVHHFYQFYQIRICIVNTLGIEKD